MSSGNFCFAADKETAELKEKCQRLEQDKIRLNSQLNTMLRTYKEMQTKYLIADQIKEQDDEGLQTTFQDLIS